MPFILFTVLFFTVIQAHSMFSLCFFFKYHVLLLFFLNIINCTFNYIIIFIYVFNVFFFKAGFYHVTNTRDV